MHRTASPSLLIGALLMMVAVGAHALGFGRADGQHLLGQPLTFRIPLNLDADESIGAECASAEILAGDQRVAADSVRAVIEAGSEPGSRVLRITTRASIDEPIVTVNASIGCPTRLSRRFVLFLDPPVVQVAAAPAREAAEPAAPAQAARAASAPEAPPAAAPSVPLSQSESAAQPRAKRTARPATRTRSTEPVAVARAPRERLRAAAPAASAAAARPRLQLEPLEPVMRAAAPAVSASAPIVVADAAVQAASAASAASQANDRVRALEESLARLKNETKAAQDSMAEMRARLRAAESSRYDRFLVYGLIGLVILLAVLLGLLMLQRSRERRAMWWAAAGQAAASAPPEPEPPAPLKVPAKPAQRKPLAEVTDSGAAPLTTTPAALQPTQPVPMADAEPRREVTVEELIDLEQQAEFFLVLGQDDAAIDLLMGHLRSTGGSSPLPYLKLLEIYRRRNEREAYERIRERFNQRFNAHAPAWETDFAHGRSLEDYPDVIGRVQSLWRLPSLAMRELESLLFRQDQQGPSFDLPAYREVLFLYSMARDLAQEEANGGGVDLLLPIGDDSGAEQPVPLIPDVPASELHIDLDLGPEEETEVTQGRKPVGR